MGSSYQKYLKVSDGFFAHKDPHHNTTMVFRPVSILQAEHLIVIPTGMGGVTWFRLEKREQEILVRWAMSGGLFRSYKYQGNMLIYDFLAGIIDDVDLVEPRQRSKLFKFVDEETEGAIEEDQWRSPLRSPYRHHRAPPAPRVRPEPVAKPQAKTVKKRPGKKA